MEIPFPLSELHFILSLIIILANTLVYSRDKKTKLLEEETYCPTSPPFFLESDSHRPAAILLTQDLNPSMLNMAQQKTE